MKNYTIVRCGIPDHKFTFRATSPAHAMMLMHSKHYDCGRWTPPTLDTYNSEWIVESDTGCTHRYFVK